MFNPFLGWFIGFLKQKSPAVHLDQQGFETCMCRI